MLGNSHNGSSAGNKSWAFAGLGSNYGFQPYPDTFHRGCGWDRMIDSDFFRNLWFGISAAMRCKRRVPLKSAIKPYFHSLGIKKEAIMDIKKVVPTNWFSREENQTGTLPAQQEASSFGSLAWLHQEMDRVVENAFRDFRLPSVKLGHLFDNVTLRPKADVASTDKEYTVTFEIPGVDQEDVKLELAHDGTLTVRGEKRQEKEQKDKSFYRVERSYGSFQRTLSLPEDADFDSINASFKNGVLTITCARKAIAQAPTRRIEIKKVA